MKRLTKADKREQEHAIAELRQIIKPGDTVIAVVRHIARSGMQRQISLFTLQAPSIGDRRPLRPISSMAASAIGWTLVNTDGGHWAIKVHGAGMDMVWHTVDVLSRVLGAEYTGKLHPETL